MMKHILMISSAALLMTSCASLSSYQDARTLEQGKAQMFIGGGTYTEQYPEQSDQVAQAISEAIEDYKTPLIEAGLRVGVMEKLDLGLKYTIPGGIVFDGKYQLLGGKEDVFAISSGAKVGYLSIKQTVTVDGQDQTSEWTTIDATVPLYLSYYPLSWLSVTVSPDYTFRHSTSSEGGSTNANVYGANASLKLGSDWGLVVEYGYHLTDAEGVDAYQQAGAVLYWPISFGLKDLFNF